MSAPDRIEVAALRAFMVEGRRVEVGEVVELPLADALEIIGMGRAEAVGAAARHVRTRATAQWSEPPPEVRRASWDVINNRPRAA
jgi:hypothetical protein